MHGGLISAIATANDVNVAGIRVAGGAVAHVSNVAYELQPGPGGSPIRTIGIVVPGDDPPVLEAPYLWPPSANPPLSTDESNVLVTEHGKDLFIETDCDETGDCDGAGTETHMMIYAADECGTTDPWFDTVVGSCRAVSQP